MANQDRIDSVIDVPALEKEVAKTLALIQEVVDALKKGQEALAQLGTSYQGGQGGGTNPSGPLGQQAALARELIKLKNSLATTEAKLALAQSDEAKQLAAQNAALAEQNRQLKANAQAQNADYQARVKAKEAAKQQAAAAKEAARLAKEEAKINAQLSSAYGLLSKAYDDAKKKYQDYAAELGLSNKITIQAQADAKSLYDQLLAIDKGAGDFKRNVGNYASAFNGIGVSLQQVLRELPSAAVSLNTFFLAISNNLPVLFDEISKINKANKEAKETAKQQAEVARTQAVENAKAAGASDEAAAALGEQAAQTALAAAEGKKGVSAFKALAASLFSFQTLLTIGVTLLTVYGKDILEFGKNLIFGAHAADQAEIAFENLMKAYKDEGLKTAYENVARLRIEVDLAKQSFIDKDKVVKDFNDTIGKTVGEEKTLAGVEQSLIDNADDYIKFTLLKAQATAALKAAAEESIKAQVKQREAANTLGSLSPRNPLASFSLISASFKSQQSEVAQETSTELQKIAKDLYDQLAKLAKEKKFNFFDEDKTKTKQAQDQTNEILSAKEKELEEQRKIDQAIYAENQKSLELIFNDDKKSIDERLTASAEYYANKYALVKIGTEAELTETQTKLDKILAIEKKSVKDRTNEENNLLLNKKALQLTLERIQAENQVKVNEINAEGEAENTKILESESKKQYDIIVKQLNDISAEGRKSGLNDVQIWDKQKKFLENSLDDLNLNAEDRKKIQEGIVDITDKTEKKIAEITKTSNDNKRKAYTDFYQTIVHGAQEAAQLIADVFTASLKRQQDELSKQNEQIDKNKQLQIDAINASALTEEEKQKRIIVAEEEARVKREENEKRIADLKVRQAKLDKIVNAAQSAGNTLAAITELKGRLAEATARASILGAASLSNPLLIPAASAMTAAAGFIGGTIVATAAIGAAQVAQILATPVPAYAEGKDAKDPYTGKAIMGEAGPELLISKDGRLAFADKPTLFHTRAGDTVLSNEQLKQGAALPYLIGTDDNRTQQELSDKLDELIYAVKRQKAPVINFSRDTEYMNMRTNARA